jgi:hypothetical protein
MWKIVRGLYFSEVGRILPESTPFGVRLYTSMMIDELRADVVARPVFRTASMGRYPRVFDYKWGCVTPGDEGPCGHAVLMRWWESLIICLAFPEPSRWDPRRWASGVPGRSQGDDGLATG